MKTYKKIFLVIAVMVVVIVGSFNFYNVYWGRQDRRTYYPMGGEVIVIDKVESGSDYYIVIEESPGEQFVLSCTKSDYDLVSVGDKVNCERYQNIVTRKGEVHKIKPIS